MKPDPSTTILFCVAFGNTSLIPFHINLKVPETFIKYILIFKK